MPARSEVCHPRTAAENAPEIDRRRVESLFWSVYLPPALIIQELTGIRTEPNTGLETLKLRTLAVRDGEYYKISGQKM